MKVFVVKYDLADMPPRSKTFIRQRYVAQVCHAAAVVRPRTCANPIVCSKQRDGMCQLKYAVHLQFASSRRRSIYLHTDIRVVFSHRIDETHLDIACSVPEPRYAPLPDDIKL